MGVMVSRRGLSLHFLVNDGIEPLLRCFFAICISGKASLAHFLGGVAFSLWSFESSPNSVAQSSTHPPPTAFVPPATVRA